MLPCTGPGAYPASWISGVTRAPRGVTRAPRGVARAVLATAGTLLITYDEYCVTGTGTGEATTAEGFGLAEYDPASNLLGPVTTVFSSGSGLPLLKQQVLGSPILARGHLGVEVGADPGRLGLGDPAVRAQCLDQIVHLPGRGPMQASIITANSDWSTRRRSSRDGKNDLAPQPGDLQFKVPGCRADRGGAQSTSIAIAGTLARTYRDANPAGFQNGA